MTPVPDLHRFVRLYLFPKLGFHDDAFVEVDPSDIAAYDACGSGICEIHLKGSGKVWRLDGSLESVQLAILEHRTSLPELDTERKGRLREEVGRPEEMPPDSARRPCIICQRQTLWRRFGDPVCEDCVEEWREWRSKEA